MVTCNNTLVELGDAAVSREPPLFGSITFHHLGLYITGIFAVIASIIAIVLIFLHATHYSVPSQQKHVIRILIMLPIYAVFSFVAYKDFKHSIYWTVLSNCYEAIAISSFFTLMCHYLERDLHEQKERFRQLGAGRGLKNWVWPLPWIQKCTGGEMHGWLRIPRSGLTWFNIIYVGIFQYCFIRVFFTLVAMASQFENRYCESSLSPAFAHIWVLSFEALGVTIAMYCIIQFYVQLKSDLAEHRPLLKVACIKLVIFFSFWQTLAISILTSTNFPGGAPLKSSERIAEPDLQVGIPNMLIAIEMTGFAVMHIFAFPWREYDISKNPDPAAQYQGGFMGLRALWDVCNLWDIIKGAARGFKWLFVGVRRREQDISYEATRVHTLNGGAGAGGKFADVETAYGGTPPKYSAAGYGSSHPYPRASEEQELGTLRPQTQQQQHHHHQYQQSPLDSGARPAPLGRTISDESDPNKGLLSHHHNGSQAAHVSASANLGSIPRHDNQDARPYGPSTTNTSMGIRSDYPNDRRMPPPPISSTATRPPYPMSDAEPYSRRTQEEEHTSPFDDPPTPFAEERNAPPRQPLRPTYPESQGQSQAQSPYQSRIQDQQAGRGRPPSVLRPGGGGHR